jgi:enoyl-CoA hydratase
VSTSFSGYETIRFERNGTILIVTLDNPRSKVNAIDDGMHHELARLFAELREERRARAIILTGSDQYFSAGGDLTWIRDMEHGDLNDLRQIGKRIVWDLLDLELPIVAAVNGPAIGLGATLALLSDVVIMSESARIADPHVRIGLVAGDGGAVLWPLIVGPMLAKRYLLTGDSMTAAEAHRLGLAAEVVADRELESRSLAFASHLAASAPLAVRYTKLAINQLVKNSATIAFDYSTSLEVVTFGSVDHKEAVQAFMDKREPEFGAD